MVIYFDTEFTRLGSHPNLISIGLIDRSGDSFYAELKDNYCIEECGSFCLKNVLNQLEHKDCLSFRELQNELYKWLKYKKDGLLLCDSEHDLQQINTIFPEGLPYHLSMNKFHYLMNIKRRMVNYHDRIHRKFNLRPHHALDDAKVNRLICENLWDKEWAS